MNKVAHYLQQHLSGEILTSPDVLEHFSTDESILRIKPLLIAHPRNEQDVRKTARFSWQLAERGKIIPITMRGKGTDLTGGAIGDGIILSTPAHMNKIIQLDPKSGEVTVESGISAAKLQQTLHTHGRYIPSFPFNDERVTVGGLISNNDPLGEAYAYGPSGEFVSRLRVVLANGEVVETSRLSKRELNKKLGLASFEGEIYRTIDTLIEENIEAIELIRSSERPVPGYSIADVKLSDGSFDLTPLIVGSQGSLGLVTEVTFFARQHNPDKKLIVAFFDDYERAMSSVEEINNMKKTPLTLDFIDDSVVEYAKKTNPSILKNTFGSSMPKCTLFISYSEGDNMGKRDVKNMRKILETNADDLIDADENKEQWEAASHLTGLFIAHSDDQQKALPVIPQAYVPLKKMAEFISKAKELVQDTTNKHAIVYGQAGLGVVSVFPLFDISQLGDRQKIFKLLDAYYTLVADLGGSIASATKSGRLLSSQMHKFIDNDQLLLMSKVKKIFDPFNMLNQGVMQNAHVDTTKSMLRESYTLSSQHVYFPSGR